MKQHEAEKLIETIRSFVDTAHVGVDMAKGKDRTVAYVEPPKNGQAQPVGKLQIDRDNLEAIYLEIKNRLIDDMRTDPILLKLVAAQPEILIELEPTVIEMEGTSLKGRIARLIGQGFVDEQRKAGGIRAELARTGSDVNSGNLSRALSDFVREGLLTFEAGDTYRRAPGLKVTEKRLST